MQMDPYTHLWLVEQDRERAMTQRALERAARSGGAQTPGLARGGISLAQVLRQVSSAAAHVHLGGLRRAFRLTRSAGV
ncbi:MAG: hypothetical protein Q7S35_01165 [Candidatus Limnocylindrales bacterium]|nr:hypothetical protein [Candidatus Limnocylindrales bacterium]